MIALALRILQLAAGLVGLRLSPFATGALAAASIAVGLAGAAGYLVHVGASRAEQACEAGAACAE
jgi:membrane protein DedA with SNARE-associated domain